MTRRLTRVLTLAVLIAAPLVGSTCVRSAAGGAGTGSARAAIDSIYRGMETAFLRGDAAAIARTYADDAEWYVPEQPVVRGRVAIERAWQEVVGRGGNQLRIDVAEVEQRGDRAHEIGRFTATAPDGSVLNAGKYLVVWVRQPDGAWRVRRDIFNWDIPPRRP